MTISSQFATAIEAAHCGEFDRLGRSIWDAHGAGQLTDIEASGLAATLQARRRGTPTRSLAACTPTPGRPYIQRSPEQRSPDRRASILRRRQHAATGPLPPQLAAGFTTGEQAVMKVLADEWLSHGACDRSLNELAARAGVCRSLAKRTIRLAELDGLITVQRRPRSGRKHLPNIVRIIRAEWIDWLAKGRRKAYAVNACNRAKPIFAEARGVQNNPPRSQDFRKAIGDRVDKTVKKDNRAGASRA